MVGPINFAISYSYIEIANKNETLKAIVGSAFGGKATWLFLSRCNQVYSGWSAMHGNISWWVAALNSRVLCTKRGPLSHSRTRGRGQKLDT